MSQEFLANSQLTLTMENDVANIISIGCDAKPFGLREILNLLETKVSNRND